MVEITEQKIAPPAFCFIEITHTCNLHCRMCHLWTTTEDHSKSLHTSEKVEIIRQFHEMNPDGTVVLTGGETMSKIGEFMTLYGICHELGLTCSANTNGTLITPENVKDLVRHGPKYLVVSLDSLRPELHDSLRGVKGTFQRATDAIRLIVEEKNTNPGSGTGVYTNCVVMEDNYRELSEYVDFIKMLGADGVMFQMLSRTFGLRGQRDVFFETHIPHDIEDFTVRMADFRDHYSKDGFVKTDAHGFDYMLRYAREPDFVSQEICASGENNLMIDSYGNVQLCFNMYELTGGRFLGNVRDKQLRGIWVSPEASIYRSLMNRCRKSCGILNCHRRSD